MAVLPNKTVAPVAIVPNEQTQASVCTKALMSAFDVFVMPATAVADARKALGDTQDSELGVRETLMDKLAKTSAKLAWKADFIRDNLKDAIEQWQTGRNHKVTTLNQFAVELRRAMHPAARDHVAEAITTSHEAWDAERAKMQAWRDAKAADKDSKIAKPDEPLMRVFGKRYHMVAGNKGMLQAYIDATEDNASVTELEASDPNALAEIRQTDEREDPKLAAKTLKRLFDTLESIHAEFPASEIEAMLKFSKKISVEKLEAAKAEKAKEAKRAARSAKKTPIVTDSDDDDDDDTTTDTTTDATTDAVEDLISVE